jgi:hypothetical protein
MEKGRVPVFFLVALTVWTAMNAYVLWRVLSLPVPVRLLPRAAVIGVAACLWASYLLARVLESAGMDGVARVLEWVGANWFGIVFLAFVCLLAVDIITGFGYWLSGMAPRLRVVAVMAACALAIFANVQGRRAPVVREYEVSLQGLPATLDGTTLAVVSDTHLGTMIGSQWLDRRVDQVQALKPDLIILAGDIVEGDTENDWQIAAGLRRLSAPLGVWGVTGNHEFYAGLDRSVRMLNSAGVRVLRDESVEVTPGLVISGVDDLTARRRRGGTADYLQRALAKRPAGATVFVSHSPLQPERAAQLGVGLMLSGHTHDGQIWPFMYFVRLTYPLIYGRYDINGMTAIVGRGTGTWGPRMRLWGRSEILKITLRSRATA